jgi:hypothetical protein
MVVHDLSANKFFQLLPLNVTFVERSSEVGVFDAQLTLPTERISLSAYNAVSDLQRVCIINPRSTDIYDGDTDTTYNGTGAAEDAWQEISVPTVECNVLSQNKTINNVVTITETEYNDLVSSGNTDIKTLYVIL